MIAAATPSPEDRPDLDGIVGQPAVRHLRRLAENPRPRCILIEGAPGIGKSASAYALANALGCEDDFSGLHVVPASELTIDECRRLFDRLLRTRPLGGSTGWKVLVIEELDGLTSKQVERYLKVHLEHLPIKTIVIATSNSTEGIDAALLQRFRHLRFGNCEVLARGCRERLAELWAGNTEAPMPSTWETWGTTDDGFSMRLAIRRLVDALEDDA